MFPLQWDDLEIHCVSGGRSAADGGNMFGVVPKMLWQRKRPADEHNRIMVDNNCLLIQTQGKNIVVDTGYGSKGTERQRRAHHFDEGHPLVNSLGKKGVAPDDVDIVVLTHLHFDHAGGCTHFDGDRLRLVFPRAKHFANRIEWEDATSNRPELANAYFPWDTLPIEEAGLLELVDDEAEILPGVATRRTGGHTRGHQMAIVGKGERRAMFPADLCCLTPHLQTFWTLAYDQFPLETRRQKPIILGEAADRGWLVFFCHDLVHPAGYICRDNRGAFRLRDEPTNDG